MSNVSTAGLRPCQITQEVIDAINGELDYQTTLVGTPRSDEKDYGVSGQLVCLDVYTHEAMVAWAKHAGEEKALDAVRKVAAICVRALVQYGCPKRVVPTQG